MKKLTKCINRCCDSKLQCGQETIKKMLKTIKLRTEEKNKKYEETNGKDKALLRKIKYLAMKGKFEEGYRFGNPKGDFLRGFVNQNEGFKASYFWRDGPFPPTQVCDATFQVDGMPMLDVCEIDEYTYLKVAMEYLEKLEQELDKALEQEQFQTEKEEI